MFEIEKNVPLSGKARAQYPFDKMSVGDSFLLPVELVERIRNAAHMQYRRHRTKFTVRRVDENNFRCWRVE